jgi:hypothetical protein
MRALLQAVQHTKRRARADEAIDRQYSFYLPQDTLSETSSYLCIDKTANIL